MNHALRLAALAALVAGLPACNTVVSNEPWFTAADTRSAPDLRDGLWVMLTDDHCRVNLKKPAERWPDCASPFYVRGRKWLHMEWDDGGSRKRSFAGWESVPILLAAGDPAILQLEGSDAPASAPDAKEIVIESDEPHWRYSYAAMRPTQLDSLGRVTAFEFWSVECGPLEIRFEGGVEYSLLDTLTEDYVTGRPFPGLTVVGDRCTAESADALRRAAVSSRAMSQPVSVRWVRVGWR